MRGFRTLLLSFLVSSLVLVSACSPESGLDFTDPDHDGSRTATVVALNPFITGELGIIDLPKVKGSMNLRGGDAADFADPALDFLNAFALDQLNAIGDEEFEAVVARKDRLGNVIIRFDQRLNGLPVRGAQLVVEARADTGVVTRVNGHFVPDLGLPEIPQLDAGLAIERALDKADIQPAGLANDIELAYVMVPGGAVSLAWGNTVDYVNSAGPQRDIVFADAMTGDISSRHPQYHYARELETYNCGNQTTCNTIASDSPDPISTVSAGIDLAIASAHNYAIATYDYYSNTHGRDSIDGNGMTLKSRVHYKTNYNNAFWDGSQMTYGDGDGVDFGPLSQDADVVAHELTHGVTSNTSNLIYSYESGALNEALSDIFGAVVDRQQGANENDTWLIGEDIYTPGIPGDALRNMADPQAQGDFDYYPTRYQGSSDNGGVHWNSGIANLAFKLLVTGGTHPRDATTNVVTALDADFDTSMAMAAKIFYQANVNCLSAGSDFEDARNCTASRALALHGAAAEAAVHEAWDAVGVPGSPNIPPPPPAYEGPLDSGVAQGGLWAAKSGDKLFYTLEVPEGATNLTFTIGGGTGDADLYVRFGAAPTDTTYDCRPYKNGNSETCSFNDPQAGTWHVVLKAYSSFSDLTLTGTYTGGGGGGGGGGDCYSTTNTPDLTGAAGSTSNYTVEVPECASSLTISISGGTGDADLYVKFGSAPGTFDYDCRPFKNGNNESCLFTPPSAGTYHIALKGYANYSGVTLTTTHE